MNTINLHDLFPAELASADSDVRKSHVPVVDKTSSFYAYVKSLTEQEDALCPVDPLTVHRVSDIQALQTSSDPRVQNMVMSHMARLSQPVSNPLPDELLVDQGIDRNVRLGDIDDVVKSLDPGAIDNSINSQPQPQPKPVDPPAAPSAGVPKSD